MNVGAFSLSPAVMVAPMAGVTDLPFRETVHDFGRVWVEGEMVSANPDLLESNESERKIAFGDEPSPRIVQLLGAARIYAAEDPSYEKIALVYRAHGASLELLPLSWKSAALTLSISTWGAPQRRSARQTAVRP